MKSSRQSRRYPVARTGRRIGLCVITFKDLAWKDHTALLLDISRHGMGIESGERLEPGFAWFQERVSGHRSGVLMWSKQAGDVHRGGVRFVSLSRDEEQFVNEQIGLLRSGRLIEDPVAVIMTIMESLTQAGPARPPSPRPPGRPDAGGGDDDGIGEHRRTVSSD